MKRHCPTGTHHYLTIFQNLVWGPRSGSEAYVFSPQTGPVFLVWPICLGLLGLFATYLGHIGRCCAYASPSRPTSCTSASSLATSTPTVPRDPSGWIPDQLEAASSSCPSLPQCLHESLSKLGGFGHVNRKHSHGLGLAFMLSH